MAWKKVEGGNTENTWNFENPLNNLEKGAELEGCFEGIEEINTSYGAREVALIRDASGTVNAVFLTTALKTYLSKVPECSLVKITCLGKVKSEKTKRRYWDFEVLYDDEVNCCSQSETNE